MNYVQLCEQGYLIGSGTVESACKQIASLRLCCAGARWSKDGLVKTAKARATWLLDAWDVLIRQTYETPPSGLTTYVCSRFSQKIANGYASMR